MTHTETAHERGDLDSLDDQVFELIRDTFDADSQDQWDRAMDKVYQIIGGIHEHGVPGSSSAFAQYVLMRLQPALHDRMFYCRQKGFEVPAGLTNTMSVLLKILSGMVLEQEHPDATNTIRNYARGRSVSLHLPPEVFEVA